MCTLLPYAPRITVVSWALCQALLVTLPVKIPHVPHVQSIMGGRIVLVGVVMVNWVCAQRCSLILVSGQMHGKPSFLEPFQAVIACPTLW